MIKKLSAMLCVVILATACSGSRKNCGEWGRGGAHSSGSALFMSVGDRVFFDFDSSVIRSEGQETLKKQAAIMQKHPKMAFIIEGHCDERGTREYNLALGERRANAVKKFLMSLGVAGDRISVISYGKDRPEMMGSTEEAWAKNRRAVTTTNNN